MERYVPTRRKRRHSSRQGASTSQGEGDQPPRSRLRGSGRIGSRTSSSSVEIVDVTTQADELVCVVDLTDENDLLEVRPVRGAHHEDVVDLTEVPDTVERVLPRRRRRRARPRLSAQRAIIPILSDDSDEENDIMVLPEINICDSHRRDREENMNRTSTPRMGQDNAPQNPRVITCPICMESESSLRNSGHQLMSTNCGHVFCRPCIRVSIQTQHRCPTCRKKLTIRQIHPIFL